MLDVMNVNLDIFQTKLTVCFNKDSFDNTLKSMYGSEKEFGSGITLTLEKDNLVEYMIGIKDNSDIRSVKSLIVHEITHVVSNILNVTGIEDDETRAYLTQYIYVVVIKAYDKYVEYIYA